LANSLKKILTKNKSLSIANHLSNLSAKGGSLWETTKQILQHKPTIPPIKKIDGSFASSDIEKAELFKNLYEIFQPHPDCPNVPRLATPTYHSRETLHTK